MDTKGSSPGYCTASRDGMRIHDWLIRPDSTPQETAPSPLRVRELLPSESIRIGPPGAEDKVEISAMAHMLLQASEWLASAEDSRLERLRTEYLKGHWEPDPERLASRLAESMTAPEAGEENSRMGRGGR